MKSLGKFPDRFVAEIAEQPQALRRAGRGLVEQSRQLARLREAVASCRSILFTGMGSSYDACYPVVTALAGQGTGMERDYDYSSAVHLSDLEDAAMLGRRAGEKAVARLNPSRPKNPETRPKSMPYMGPILKSWPMPWRSTPDPRFR